MGQALPTCRIWRTLEMRSLSRRARVPLTCSIDDCVSELSILCVDCTAMSACSPLSAPPVSAACSRQSQWVKSNAALNRGNHFCITETALCHIGCARLAWGKRSSKQQWAPCASSTMSRALCRWQTAAKPAAMIASSLKGLQNCTIVASRGQGNSPVTSKDDCHVLLRHMVAGCHILERLTGGV